MHLREYGKIYTSTLSSISQLSLVFYDYMIWILSNQLCLSFKVYIFYGFCNQTNLHIYSCLLKYAFTSNFAIIYHLCDVMLWRFCLNYALCQIKFSFLLLKYASKYNSLLQKSSQVPTPNPYRCETGGFDHHSTWVQDIHANHGCTNCYAKNGSPRGYVHTSFYVTMV